MENNFSSYSHHLRDQVVGTSRVIVVSPLLPLIKDEVKQINENCGISAVGIYEGQIFLYYGWKTNTPGVLIPHLQYKKYTKFTNFARLYFPYFTNLLNKRCSFKL